MAKKSKQGQDAYIGIRMPASLVRRVDRLAKKEGVSRSDMIRRMLTAFLK